MVRVRFAPSPTGELHVGGARTALYNYLFARKQQGKFIIRIEDTDQERLVPGSLERLLAALKWFGLDWDEGPDKGGDFGPYVQSERLELYKKYADELVRKGLAYYCFCTAQRLEVLRELQQSQHLPTKYDGTCLKITPADAAARVAKGESHTIRLKVNPGHTHFVDRIRGEVIIDNATLDDQILLKSDGFPTYHLANVVDDHLMEITHVIRGEEWLPSTPKHILLYQAFGWTLPEFAHLPNVLNEKRAKLSKRRDGEAVWVQTYQQQGYLPEAMLNFLGLLGWHPKDDTEVLSLPQFVEAFDLDRVQKGGAIFSLQKLHWFNATYIKKLTIAQLDELLKPFYEPLAKASGRKLGATRKLTEILQSRLTVLNEVAQHSQWYFKKDPELTTELLVPAKGTPAKTVDALQAVSEMLERWSDTRWTRTVVRDSIEVLIRPGTFTRGELLWPVRVALTGEKQSPDVVDVAWVLGREECERRIRYALKVLNNEAGK